MCDSYYKRAIKPLHQCSFMGLEKVIHVIPYDHIKIYISRDNFGQHRIYMWSRIDLCIVSAIIFDSYDTVKVRYTLPTHRGHGYTKQLFALACKTLNKSFRHSDNLTIAGQHSL